MGAVFSWYVYFLLAVFGGLGVIARFALTQLTANAAWYGLPLPTLLVNIIGSFLIGFISVWVAQKSPLNETLQLVLMVGFLGGFTTFSAFSLEAIRVYELSGVGRMVSYMFISVVAAVACCLAGLLVARRLI